jgi:hypothetical protein
VINDPKKLGFLLTQAGFSGSLDEKLKQMLLAYTFAGRDQWIANVTGKGVKGNLALQNVGLDADINALRMFVGQAMDLLARGKGDKLREIWSQRRQTGSAENPHGVASWASDVFDKLTKDAGSVYDALKGTRDSKSNIGWSLEALADPNLNLYDPSKPFFGENAIPISLFNEGVLQMGERGFLRGLSAPEFMLGVGRLAHAYYDRPAGSPVPQGMEAGLTFGSPVRNADGSYARSPVMGLDEYKRWSAYQMPGDPTMPSAGADFLPYTGDPSAPYAPQNLDADTLQRLLAVALSTMPFKQNVPVG